MVRIRVKIIVVILFTLLNNGEGVSYGPSIVELTRYNKEVNGPTIFHPDTGRLLHLQDYPNYSVIVPLAPDSATATSNQVFISRRLSGPGEFVVQAPEGFGVMAVVQSMDLRVASTGCNDFIQFGETEGGVETTGTCGKVDNRDGSAVPSSLLGPRVFWSPNGKMRVLFYHGYIWGLVRDFNFDLLDPSRNPVLRVEIVFTAYKDCATLNPTTTDFRSCSQTNSNSVRRTCIKSNLFCDRILNCGLEDDFGADEYVSNCLPNLLNLLIPGVLNIPVVNEPVQLVEELTTPRTTSTTTRISSISRFNTPRPTTTTSTTTTRPSTTSTPVSTTISTISTSATPQTTTESSVISTTSLPFTKQIRDYVLDISGSRSTIRRFEVQSTTPRTTTTTSVKPTTSTTLKPIGLDSVQQKLKNLTEVLMSNMPFSVQDSNTLFADVEEPKVEQLGDQTTTPDPDAIDPDSESSSGALLTILWIGLAIVLFAMCLFLKNYCCSNRVIWVPNPKALRRRKKRETSVYGEGQGQFPEIHVNPKRKGSRSIKETPPSYDILFPNDQKQDFLP